MKTKGKTNMIEFCGILIVIIFWGCHMFPEAYLVIIEQFEGASHLLLYRYWGLFWVAIKLSDKCLYLLDQLYTSYVI